MRTIGLILAATVLASSLSGQESNAPARRWSVTGAIGSVQGGPASSASRHLAATGWGDVQPAWCFLWCVDAQDYPLGDSGATSELALRYELTSRWAVSAGMTGRLLLGDARGYRHIPVDEYNLLPGDHVDSHFEGSSRWVAAHIKADERLSGGLGLALHRVTNEDEFSADLPSSHERIGLMGEADVRLPGKSRVFWNLALRGHWVPWTVRFLEPSNRNGPVPLDVSVSYATITTGIGIRF